MFCVDLGKTKTLLMELQSQLRVMNHVLYEIEESTAKYSGENDAKECNLQMRIALEELQRERMSYLTLVSLLREIVEQYEETEDNVLDAFEMHIRRNVTEPTWLVVEYSDEIRNFINRVIAWKGAANGECD